MPFCYYFLQVFTENSVCIFRKFNHIYKTLTNTSKLTFEKTNPKIKKILDIK